MDTSNQPKGSNQPKRYIGWDIGGAHLKVAQILSTGNIEAVRQIVCPLWCGIDKLEDAYYSLCNEIPTLADVSSNSVHVVTMTGELTDGFNDREQGVCSILSTMQRLLAYSFLVYTSDRGIINNKTITDTASVASMNWRASAEWLAVRYDEGMLVDMGSTTTDIVPFKSGRIAVRGYDDATRMQCGELIYSGISRTPVMAIAEQFIINGISHPIMAESFSTIADVYRILDNLEEDRDLYPTSDNADKTIASSARRLERMFGLDWNEDLAGTRIKARAIAQVQQQKIRHAIVALLQREQLANSTRIIGAGAGYKIVQRIAESLGIQFIPYYRLWDNLSDDLEDIVCCCATAVSVAALAHLKYG
ncbi:MAG: hypothetical protein GDA45_04020 [Chromatiales bacterium]|nr:hypothetical protein [Chromatiales bacterium]